MAKTTKVKAESKLDEPLKALHKNTHFIKFIEALKVNCRHGDTVFGADDRQTCYALGRQDVANFIQKKLDALGKPPE